MITLWILIAHLFGDYIIQTDWMAQEKTKRWLPAIVHGLTYTLPFLFITTSIPALLIIGGTHVILDRYRVAKYMVWAKNQLAPKAWRYSLAEAKENSGAPKGQPAYMAVWLMIIMDNTVHLAINLLAVLYL
jgi:hypothetical protein